MSILDFQLDNLPELHAVEQGEYEVECVNASIYENENTKKKSVRLDLVIVDDEEADDLRDFISLPHEDDTPKTKIKKLIRLRDAASAFGVDISSGIDTEDFIGQTAKAFLTKESDKVYGEQNSVQKYLS